MADHPNWDPIAPKLKTHYDAAHADPEGISSALEMCEGDCFKVLVTTEGPRETVIRIVKKG